MMTMTPPHLLPATAEFPPRHSPAEVLEVLAEQLTGPGRFYIVSDGVLGVLSLPGVSIWSNGRVLWWRVGDDETSWPAADAPGAVRILSSLAGRLLAAPLGTVRSSWTRVGAQAGTPPYGRFGPQGCMIVIPLPCTGMAKSGKLCTHAGGE